MKKVTESPGAAREGRRRLACRRAQLCLLLLLCWLTPESVWSQSSPAPAAAAFPSWLVPVLRVLDDGRVVPTTGVVLADDRVLVPSEFTAGGGALIALDGGADLVTHGREASVIRRLPLAGLAVLEVPGLRRPAPRLATGPLRDGQVVLLQALAPPDLLARGEARVRQAGRVVRLADGAVSLDPSTPLPNVTGVLVDGCGQLAGYSAARGAASMGTSSATLYQWVPELSVRLAEAGLLPESGPCAVDAVHRPVAPDSRPGLPTGPAVPEEPATKPATAAEAGSAPEPEPEPRVPAPRDFPELIPDSEPFPGPEASVQASGEPSAGFTTDEPGVLERLGPWALGVLVLLLTGFGLHRSRSRSSTMQRVACLLEGEAGRLEVLARDGEVDAVIGRFDVDLVIEAVTVSRRHARLFGTLGRLQLMDLGSTNGTRVNGQPCAARVAVTVSPGDRLRFGDQEFVLQSVSGSRA